MHGERLSALFQRLKVSQLKHICQNVGASPSGNKSLLASNLIDAAYAAKLANGKKIISVDMGIRNLAACALVNKPKPQLHWWELISISQNVPGEKENFEPIELARKAHALIHRFLHEHQPDVIVIERQRFRTMGQHSVQEWTLRVNMFESMLHAVLRTLQECEKWSGQVYSVYPLRLGQYWSNAVGDEGLSAKDAKMARIKFIQDKLIKQEIEVMTTAMDQVNNFSQRKGPSPKKQDDLADCLLQGISFLRWHRNRQILKDYISQEHGLENLPF